MSKRLETELSIPLSMDDDYSPQQMLDISRRLKEHCLNLDETVTSRLVVKQDALEAASQLYDMVERLGWYVLGQIAKGKLKHNPARPQLILDTAEMRVILRDVMINEKIPGFKYQTSDAAKELERKYNELTKAA